MKERLPGILAIAGWLVAGVAGVASATAFLVDLPGFAVLAVLLVGLVGLVVVVLVALVDARRTGVTVVHAVADSARAAWWWIVAFC